MTRRAMTAGLWLAASCPMAAQAAEPARLRSGAYAVEVRLGLPHVEEVATATIARLCVTEAPDGGLTALSANTPLARCPVADLRRDGDALTFDIRCEGRNQASARAAYRLWPERFEGRIAMRMGGKNMTMTETQSGRRVGECGS